MGPAGLTAVFGMGTGVTPPVWSPENRPRGGQTAEAALARWLVTAANQEGKWQMPNDRFPRSHHTRSGTSATNSTRTLGHLQDFLCHMLICHLAHPRRRPDRFGAATAIVLFWLPTAESRSGWSSCLAVRTGRLRRSPAVHARPIDLVVFQEPMSRRIGTGNLISEGASRLDAFSAYPVPTWLPGDALSRTAGTPEVGPPQSSRTRGDSPQVSSAHGR